jgi:hypothetical protein
VGQIGRYCKAYYLKEFRQFSGWTEPVQDSGRSLLDESANDEDFLYLQEDYTVTRGIFADENIVFDNVTTGWIEFCRDTLRFEPPAGDPQMAAVAQSVQADGTEHSGNRMIGSDGM